MDDVVRFMPWLYRFHHVDSDVCIAISTTAVSSAQTRTDTMSPLELLPIVFDRAGMADFVSCVCHLPHNLY